jgi:hypothetical protein
MASSQLPPEDRPISEIRLGLIADPSARTDAELLAIVLGQAETAKHSDRGLLVQLALPVPRGTPRPSPGRPPGLFPAEPDEIEGLRRSPSPFNLVPEGYQS